MGNLTWNHGTWITAALCWALALPNDDCASSLQAPTTHPSPVAEGSRPDLSQARNVLTPFASVDPAACSLSLRDAPHAGMGTLLEPMSSCMVRGTYDVTLTGTVHAASPVAPRGHHGADTARIGLDVNGEHAGRWRSGEHRSGAGAFVLRGRVHVIGFPSTTVRASCGAADDARGRDCRLEHLTLALRRVRRG